MPQSPSHSVARAVRRTGWQSALLLVALWGVVLLASMSTRATEHSADWVYVSRPGDTGEQIARRFLRSDIEWTALVRHNGLRTPFDIPAGTALRIPIEWLERLPVSAQVRILVPPVFVRKHHESSFRSITDDTIALAGDEIRTGVGAQVLLRLDNGTEIRMLPESRLRINRLTRFGLTGMTDTRLELIQGRIENNIPPLQSPAGRFSVSTPGAVAAVRGTVFRMASDADETRVEVVSGVVAVETASGSSELTAGTGARTSGGRPAIEPLPLPPTLDLLGAYEASPTQLLLPPLPAGGAWRVILETAVRESADDAPGLSTTNASTGKPLAATGSASGTARAAIPRAEESAQALENGDIPATTTAVSAPQIWFSELVHSRSFRPPLLPAGDYILRVRALDENGMEGMEQLQSFTVQPGEPQIRLLLPDPAARLQITHPRFLWQTLDPLQPSSLEISRWPDFRKLLVHTPFTTRTDLEAHRPLPEGRYFWRVGVRNGAAIEYSEERSFTRLKQLSTVRINSADFGSDGVRIGWPEVTGASRYTLQVATDAGFTEILREELLSERTALLQLQRGKPWYVRVRPESDSEDAFATFGPAEVFALPEGAAPDNGAFITPPLFAPENGPSAGQ